LIEQVEHESLGLYDEHASLLVCHSLPGYSLLCNHRESCSFDASGSGSRSKPASVPSSDAYGSGSGSEPSSESFSDVSGYCVVPESCDVSALGVGNMNAISAVSTATSEDETEILDDSTIELTSESDHQAIASQLKVSS
jgi:hypothetical protein